MTTMIGDYKDLKKTLKGRNGYLFLINDSNHEIMQHFDQSYQHNFNGDIFLRFFNFKEKYCNNRNIDYYFFIVPDKSLVCKDFLPFDTKSPKRNYNSINNVIPDFIEKLDSTCYFKCDSHINYVGGKKLAHCYLNYIDNNFEEEHFNKLIDEQISILDSEHPGDLLMEKNWSYPDEEKKEYPSEKVTTFRNKYIINLNHNIPEAFKLERETLYCRNERSFTNLRVLILRDSSLSFLKDILSIYFKEVLLYWGYWSFNTELIEWYKPDIILEIKTERFLENHRFITKSEKKETDVPNQPEKMKETWLNRFIIKLKI